MNIPQKIPYVESKVTAVAKGVALRGGEHCAPDNILWNVPTRPKNRDVRSREYLLSD